METYLLFIAAKDIRIWLRGITQEQIISHFFCHEHTHQINLGRFLRAPSPLVDGKSSETLLAAVPRKGFSNPYAAR